jgi:hypothetical protein
MIRAHYRALQDFLNMLLMGVLTGVVLSLAVTGAMFLLCGSAQAAEELRVLGSPSEAGQGRLLFKSEQGYLHLHRRREPGGRENGRAVQQAGKPGAHRH